MQNTDNLDMALWRFGVISPLLHRSVNDLLLREMLDDLASRSFLHPDGRSLQVPAETIRKWLYRYHNQGLDGLRNKIRCDKGNFKVPQTIAAGMVHLRAEHPGWTLALILEQLNEDRIWDQRRPSRSVLYRFARANNLMRAPQQPEGGCRAFEYEHFGQLWIADFLHGPKLKMGRKKRKSYLHAIIDDTTRYIVSARFYPSENTEQMAHSLMAAVRRFGLPQRLYVDNGAAYRSRYLKVVCANCGIRLLHTEAYRPEGRGKIERFNRTLREQFLEKTLFTSFDHINTELDLYLQKYHGRHHSGIGTSPMQKRMAVDSLCKVLPEVADLPALFRHRRRCRVYKDGTIQLKKRRFEVPGCLPGSRVDVSFVPWDLTQVYYGPDVQPAVELHPNANAHRFDHPNFSDQKENP